MAQPTHVTFVHGIANKPPSEQLRRIWLEALGTGVDGDDGFSLVDVGVTASVVYWADLFNAEPISSGRYESVGSDIEAELDGTPPVLPEDPWIASFLEIYPDDVPDDFPDGEAEEDAGYEAIQWPRVLKNFAQTLSREVHAYLFNVDDVRDTIRQRVLDDFARVPEGTRHVLVAHSQGSCIAYDVLTGTDCRPVDGFLTLGSPLGLEPIQDELSYSPDNGFPSKVMGDWVNVYDPLDIVSRPDPELALDFRDAGRLRVIDVREQNWGVWRHDATKYFKGLELRHHLRKLCDRVED